MPAPSPTLPKIACFHGGGSNASIHKIQCARIQASLREQFELVFFDAPFVTERPGPDVLSAFKDYSPWRVWFKLLNKPTSPGSPDLPGPAVNTDAQETAAGVDDGSGYSPYVADGIDRIHEWMDEVGDGKEWVGALGFSQGTRVVGGLLADQQARKWLGWAERTNLRFGVLCMGSRSPMSSEAQKAIRGEASRQNTIIINSQTDTSGAAENRISIPSVHVHGLKDAQLIPGRIMQEAFYDKTTTRLLEIDYHHAMPWNKEDVYDLARLIMEVYNNKSESRARKEI